MKGINGKKINEILNADIHDNSSSTHNKAVMMVHTLDNTNSKRQSNDQKSFPESKSNEYTPGVSF